MKLRFKYEKDGYIRYISHLDTFRLFQRCLKRIGVPIIFSEGFNPHPKLSLGLPLPLGMASDGEFFDVEIEDSYDITGIVENLNAVLPDGIVILGVQTDDITSSIESAGAYAKIMLEFPRVDGVTEVDVKKTVDDVLSSETLMIKRRRKKGKKKILVEEDIRHGLKSLEASGMDDEGFCITAIITVGENNAVRPINLVEGIIEKSGFEIDADYVMMKRLAILDENMECL